MRAMISTLAWGLFCACSWTWCIGMYLPKIMLDRFGWAGFLVFAIPNVVGCSLFAYVVARRQRSAASVAKHGGMMVVFSIVTVAYHLFFITYLLDALCPLTGNHAQIAPIAAVVMLLAGMGLSLLPNAIWLFIAVLLYLFSLIVFGTLGLGAWDSIPVTGSEPVAELIWLAPIIIIGFLACPYLDATFHRALQYSPSKHAFSIFGVAFGVMIVFTCFMWFTPEPVRWPIILGHLLGQSLFTMGVHLREIRVSTALECPVRRRELMLLPIFAVPVLYIVREISQPMINLGDDIYLRFLGFYGLLFPAYVILFIGPWRTLALSRLNLMGFVILVIGCAPLLEMGFIHQAAWLLVFPVALLVVWAVFRQSAVNENSPSL